MSGRTIPTLAVLAILAACPVRGRAGEAPASLHDRVIRNTVVVATEKSTGSGCLLEGGAGQVLTAYHVVKELERVEVAFPVYKDGQLVTDRMYYWNNWSRLRIGATVIRRWPEKDLALIQLDRVPAGVEGLRLGGSPRVGENTHRIGTPAAKGPAWEVTVGPVVVVDRRRWKYPDGQIVDTVSVGTDATPRYGDSGSPLVNDRGELIGLHVCGGYGPARSGSIDGGVIEEMLRTVDPPLRPDGKAPTKKGL
jgi:S1-C subfamily serine protease